VDWAAGAASFPSLAAASRAGRRRGTISIVGEISRGPARHDWHRRRVQSPAGSLPPVFGQAMTRPAQRKGIIAFMSRRTHRRLSASLCLAAMLLLSALPTLGRLSGGRAMHAQAAAASSAMAHTDGMSHAQMAHARPSVDSRPTEGATASTEEHFGHECPYCPLLAGLASIEVPARLPGALPVCREFVAEHHGIATVAPRTSCLGSRGPPVSLIG
jgi:hypothetical protein